MFRQNIISAGKMMAMVLMLFGVIHSGGAFMPLSQESLIRLQPQIFRAVMLAGGAALFACGLCLLILFWKTDKNRALDTPILIAGTLTALCGILFVTFFYLNPFAWMTVILALAIFIDTLCLKLVIYKNKNAASS